ncbi:MAG: acyl-CoA dehydrogenase family protein [Spirochaetota bacterium]|nr:acyl-CoA dehydrogenase family protein [Spirochaetota bacterium]
MIGMELPEKMLQLKANMQSIAKDLFRPIAIKYDEAEHEYPKELEVLRRTQSRVRRPQKKDNEKEKGDRPKEEGLGRRMREAISIEELAWGDVGLMMSIPNAAPGNPALIALASDKQLERFGNKWTAFSITEPGTGSDSGSISTTAKLDGDEWVLNGEKIFVTAADRCDNAIIWATVDSKAGKAGVKSFVIEKGTPGFELAKLEKKMGLRASDTGSFTLTDCRIPRDNILGSAEVKKRSTEGFKGVMKSFDNVRPAVGIMATGISRAAVDFTREKMEENGFVLDYSKNVNNVSSKEKEFYLMEATVDVMRLLSWRAFWMADNGMPNSLEASMCKAKGGRSATIITQKCCEIIGPLAFSQNELAEKWMRDAKVLDIFEGTGQIQHLIIARHILGLSSNELI